MLNGMLTVPVMLQCVAATETDGSRGTVVITRTRVFFFASFWLAMEVMACVFERRSAQQTAPCEKCSIINFNQLPEAALTAQELLSCLIWLPDTTAAGADTTAARP